jgi:hypothetical protein
LFFVSISENPNMAKAENKAARLDLRSNNLNARILTAALPRIACVLKPYPEGVKPEEAAAAVAQLVDAGLVHRGKSPNLTAKGIDVARKLVERQNAPAAKE